MLLLYNRQLSWLLLFLQHPAHPTFKCPDLPSKTRHHGIIHTIYFIADFRNTMRDIREQTVMKLFVKFPALSLPLHNIFSLVFRSSMGLAASTLANFGLTRGPYSIVCRLSVKISFSPPAPLFFLKKPWPVLSPSHLFSSFY